MVHVAPPGTRRRRLDLIVGALLAILGVVVAVIAVIALHQPKGREAAKVISSAVAHSSATPSPSASATSSAPSSSAPRSSTAASTAAVPATGVKSVPLVVLNSTNQTGLALAAAKVFQAGGWTVTSSGNIDNDILSTCAYYDPSDPQNLISATALMVQFPAIKRVKEKFTGLPPGPIVVVLTKDYTA